MKVLVAYFTQTGNTKKVAEAINGEIHTEKELKPISEVLSLDGYDVSFIGFPVWQFGPAEPGRKFLETHARGKTIALFVTHAMPSDDSDPQMEEMLGGIIEKCRAAASQAKLIGFFECQGELSEQVADLLIKSDNPRFRQFGAMRAMTAGHPDTGELEMARRFARETMKKCMH